jgi:hypothetical protein
MTTHDFAIYTVPTSDAPIAYKIAAPAVLSTADRDGVENERSWIGLLCTTL